MPSVRRILLAVTGLTPQVLTETLYALHRQGPQALPHEVHVMTTTEGAQRMRLALLSRDPGWFARLCNDYAMPSIAFDESHVHTLEDASGHALDDIRDEQDNAAAADQMAEMVRQLTLEPDTALHVSLAGGRKTLGYFAGSALGLFGRDQDRLSHVLINEPFESTWDFFYPTPYQRIIQTRDGKLADCAQATVTLADIPFVRLRHGLPRDLIEGRSSFAAAVRAAQTSLAPPTLTIDFATKAVVAGDLRIALPPAELAFLAWFARRAAGDLPGIVCPKGEGDAELARDYLAELERAVPFIDRDHRTHRRYLRGMTKEDFEERKSKLKRQLVQALGPIRAQPYLVHGEGRRPMRYRLTLPREAIRFIETLAPPQAAAHEGIRS